MLKQNFSKYLVWSVLLVAGFGLAACSSDKEAPLPGERISLFEATPATPAAEQAAETQTTEIATTLPEAWENTYWPQSGGFSNHTMGHVALGEGTKAIWNASIGKGTRKNVPLTATPVVAGGMVYTLDTNAKVSAFKSETGQTLWGASVLPSGEGEAVPGGGLAFSAGRVFVTAGFREVVALNAANGETLWRVKLPNAARSAPTAVPDTVYVTTVDNVLVAINAETGKVAWTHRGLAAAAGLVGASAPAVNKSMVVPVYSSGEVYALNPENGAVLWSDTLANFARKGIENGDTDIRALPVLGENTLVAGSVSGTLAAYDLISGNRLWSGNYGGAQTPWVAGNVVFAFGPNSTLRALDLQSGAVLWQQPLTAVTKSDKKREWFGPVLAGGRLLAVGSDGVLAELDPQTGKQIKATELGLEPVAAPIVAGRSVYVLGKNGTLKAFR